MQESRLSKCPERKLDCGPIVTVALIVHFKLDMSGVDEQLERLRKNWQVGALYQKRALGDHPVRLPLIGYFCGGIHLRYFTVFEPRIARCHDQRLKCFLTLLEELKQFIPMMRRFERLRKTESTSTKKVWQITYESGSYSAEKNVCQSWQIQLVFRQTAS
jgi:hypothetical protein